MYVVLIHFVLQIGS